MCFEYNRKDIYIRLKTNTTKKQRNKNKPKYLDQQQVITSIIRVYKGDHEPFRAIPVLICKYWKDPVVNNDRLKQFTYYYSLVIYLDHTTCFAIVSDLNTLYRISLFCMYLGVIKGLLCISLP